jgi:hypothetical protein
LFERLQKTIDFASLAWFLVIDFTALWDKPILHSADTRLNHAEAQQKKNLKACHGMPRVLLQNFPQSFRMSAQS